jgi:hypothetical protein
MLFRQMLMSGASRRLFAPENDEGAEFDDIDDPIEDDEPEPDEDQDEPDEDEPEEIDDQDDPPAPPARQASRGDSRVREATRIAAEAKAEAAALKREVEALQAQRNAPPRESQEQINARLAQMEPWERTEFLRQQDTAAMNARLQQMEFNSQDSADRTAYEALAAREPIAAKLRDDVEAVLADLRKNGMTAPRLTILEREIGRRALANKTRATTRAKKSADVNRDRQASRPSNGRGDSVSTDARSGSTAARNKRLENMQI